MRYFFNALGPGSTPTRKGTRFRRGFGLFDRWLVQGNGQVTGLDKDHGLLLDEGMMGAQVRTLYPGTLGVHAVLISEGPGKHEDLFSTPVLVWNEALTSGPMDKGRPFVAQRME